MSLELYSLLNFIAMILSLAGLILPALIIYFYSSYKNHFALIIVTLVLAATIFVAGEYTIVLLPFILPIIIAGLMGSFLRKFGEDFWLSMGYMIVAEFAGMVIGVITIYFYYGMQDIAVLLANSYRDAFMSIPADDIGVYSINLLIQLLEYLQNGGFLPAAEVGAMSMESKLNIIVPLIREGMSSVLPSLIMGYGIISGVWAWLMSSLMIKKRADDKKPLRGIKEYVAYPPFSEWKMPRWFTNVLMVLLFAAILISFSAQGNMLYVASALQTVALVVLSIQGLAVVNWWLKSKKVHTAWNVVICCLVVVFLSFFLPWIGLFDIVFSVRITREQREAIMKKMKDIKMQMDQQVRKMEEEKKEEEAKENKEDSKDGNKEEDKDESEEEK